MCVCVCTKAVQEAVKVEFEVKTVYVCQLSVIQNSSMLPFPTHNALPGTQFSINSYAVNPEASTN